MNFRPQRIFLGVSRIFVGSRTNPRSISYGEQYCRHLEHLCRLGRHWTPGHGKSADVQCGRQLTYVNGGGRWIQVEGMYFFNFTNAAGLVYAANVTTDTVSGILGYAVAGSNPGSGVWWGTRPGAPHAALAAAAMPEHDILTSPVKK